MPTRRTTAAGELTPVWRKARSPLRDHPYMTSAILGGFLTPSSPQGIYLPLSVPKFEIPLTLTPFPLPLPLTLMCGCHIWMTPKRQKGGGEYRFHGRTLLTSLPSLKMRRNLWYDDCQLIAAWDETLLAIEERQQWQEQIGMEWRSDIRYTCMWLYTSNMACIAVLGVNSIYIKNLGQVFGGRIRAISGKFCQ